MQTRVMQNRLAIGDFARATHLSVKTLRYYHRVGLLEPADVDPDTGYRRYTTDQIPAAQIIRRFRNLDMPVEEVKQVLAAPDIETRNELIAAHLTRLEEGLTRTQDAVSSLRDLLARPSPPELADIGRLRMDATPAAAISEPLDIEDAGPWYQGALGELYATIDAQNQSPDGPSGGIYATELFSHGLGQATVFVPCTGPLRPMGRVDIAGRAARGVRHHRPPRPGPRHRPRLRFAGHLCHPARAGRRRADPGVLPHRPARHPRHRAVAHPDLLADLPHRTRARRSLTPHSGPCLAPVSAAINRATAPVKACSGGVAYPMTSAGRCGPDAEL